MQVLTPNEEQIVYAVHWNHSKDRHLRRADLVGRFSRPAVLITDACSALRSPAESHKQIPVFLEEVTTVLRQNGEMLTVKDLINDAPHLSLGFSAFQVKRDHGHFSSAFLMCEVLFRLS